MFNKLLCTLFGHKYKIKRKISRGIRELYCSRCGKEFGMHDGVKVVVPLDKELINLHERILKE